MQITGTIASRLFRGKRVRIGKNMRKPGFEPGISQPQCEVLTTILHTPGEAGYRSQYLSHAKRALYHLSYIPGNIDTVFVQYFILEHFIVHFLATSPRGFVVLASASYTNPIRPNQDIVPAKYLCIVCQRITISNSGDEIRHVHDRNYFKRN